jgi:hypothetical protein
MQHCSISSKFDMWVDNDVPNLFPTLKNFYRSSFSKWPPQYGFDDIGQGWIFTAHFYAVFWQPFRKWQTSWKFWHCRIAPLMVTYHYVNFSDFNTISYVGRLWCPELIPDINKFLPVTILKMATTIPHKFNIVRFQRNFI